jgi:MinD-like ATPase involved in chromosome partitioning or flagellar assembly
MSGFVCPECKMEINIFKVGGGQKIAEELDVPFLGRIPIDPQICQDADNGKLFIISRRDSPAVKAFIEIVKKIEASLKEKEEVRVYTK